CSIDGIQDLRSSSSVRMFIDACRTIQDLRANSCARIFRVSLMQSISMHPARAKDDWTKSVRSVFVADRLLLRPRCRRSDGGAAARRTRMRISIVSRVSRGGRRAAITLMSLLLLLVPFALHAQTTGTIEGQIVDQSGAALPGVTVELTGARLQG